MSIRKAGLRRLRLWRGKAGVDVVVSVDYASRVGVAPMLRRVLGDVESAFARKKPTVWVPDDGDAAQIVAGLVKNVSPPPVERDEVEAEQEVAA